MSIWIIFALMTGAAVLAVLWPLSRARAGRDVSLQAGERAFYEDQIAEIDRDLGRGLFTPEEAASAKAEAARRLIRATSGDAGPDSSLDEPALRRRRAASAIALSVVPLLALAVYGAYGEPEAPSQPLAARMEAPVDIANVDIEQAVVRIEAHLAQNPNDGRGWEVLAPVYMRMGRFQDAAAAYRSALRHLGEDAGRLANYGEALVNAQGGIVPAEARQAFEAALAHDETSPKARFFLAQAAEQDGDEAAALNQYERLVELSPPDAPWIRVVRQRLAALGAQSVAVEAPRPITEVSASPDGDAILGMVSRLEERLKSNGGSAEEWGRLVRSFAVLGREDKAAQALQDARRALSSDTAGRAAVETVAREVGIEGAMQ